MYGIFTYIYPKNGPKVGKYSIHRASGFGWYPQSRPSFVGHHKDFMPKSYCLPERLRSWLFMNFHVHVKTIAEKTVDFHMTYVTLLAWNHIFSWLVVWTPLKNISQLGWLFPIYGKIKNVPNHQPVSIVFLVCWLNPYPSKRKPAFCRRIPPCHPSHRAESSGRHQKHRCCGCVAPLDLATVTAPKRWAKGGIGRVQLYASIYHYLSIGL